VKKGGDTSIEVVVEPKEPEKKAMADYDPAIMGTSAP